MGFEWPAGIGAKVASPCSTIIDIDSEGGKTAWTIRECHGPSQSEASRSPCRIRASRYRS
ncbi:hypothetical protein HNO52_05025 [Billgrantia diversa]|uniref:hypothetical protein n=1 Tax=Halomonas sp. MCCC 1A13316 TaxID=2733487 RepID=UPI0018A3EF00|nr:hypothetical protein HNO52_05025 [Halomonas sp. MCCC 1A13316]